MKLIHQIGTNIYFLIVRIVALWNPKARLFINGRKKSILKLKSFKKNKSDLFWFHCASLGEFEQAKPLIEKLKSLNENCQIVISFFSPSGYEIRKNYELADLILYLPKDSKSNAKILLDALQPAKIFFIKYEFWANYLFEAKKRQISTYLVSGVFRKNQLFFKWYGGFMRTILKSFTNIFLQNKNSKHLLDSIKIPSLVTGDTRFDRVIQNTENVKYFPEIEAFVNNQKCIVVGSSWLEDELVIFPTLNLTDNIKTIIAPHELSESHFESIEKQSTKKVIRYSKITNILDITEYDVLLIDNIGMLMHLYQYANVAYIGGAFGKGLHNILEAASFGVPVIFGNQFSKFPEAFQFLEAKIGYSIENNADFEKIFNSLLESELKPKVLTFMTSQKGATDRIIKTIF